MGFHLLTIGLILSCLVLIAIDNNSANGIERKTGNEVNKVKCKEHVDEALRQYWDYEKKGSNEDNDDNDDDDSREVNRGDISKDDDDDDSDDKSEERDDEDEDSGETIGCKEDDNDDSNESKESKESLKSKESTEDDDNDDDDDDDEQKSKSRESEDEDDDDGDDDNDEHSKDKDDDEREKKKKRHTMTITYSKQTKFKLNRPKFAQKDESDEDDDDDERVDGVQSKEKRESKEDDGDDDDDSDDDKDEDDDSDDEKSGEKVDKSDEKDDETEKVEHRSRAHVDDILRVYEIGSQEDTAEQNLILSIFRELKKLYETAIKPLEVIYKYRHITTRLITDAELFSKPTVLFLGAKSTGKTSLVNYLLGIDSTAWQLKTGLTTTYPHLTILSYGENYTRLSPTELAADFSFSSLQQFGQHFLEQYIEAHRLPIKILQKMTIIDSPGLIDMIGKSGASQHQPKGIDNDVYQWFMDRSDVIYIVVDVSQLHLSHQLQSLIEQLKGREVRFIMSKSDVVSHSQIITLIGQLLWILSPIMPAERPPQVYALTTVPQEFYDAFLEDQEILWLKDLSNQISGISRVESRIAALRRHAVRVRNHAKLVDCYLATYYKNKGIFTFGASSRQLAADITENPQQYRIYSGTVAGLSQNISRYDLPDPGVYKEFFRSNPLFDFKPLTSTCSYFRGCPIDKLDIAIAYQLPELVGKYKKLTQMQPNV